MKCLKVFLPLVLSFLSLVMLSSCEGTGTSGNYHYIYRIEASNMSAREKFEAQYVNTLYEYVTRAGGKQDGIFQDTFSFSGKELDCEKKAIRACQDFLTFVESPEQLGPESPYTAFGLKVCIYRPSSSPLVDDELYSQKLK